MFVILKRSSSCIRADTLHFPSPRLPLGLLTVSLDIPVVDISCKWNHAIRVLCLACFTLHNVSGFIRVVAWIFSYISLMYGYTTFHLSVHHLMDIWVAESFWMLWVTLVYSFCEKYEHMFSFLLGIYWGGELLGNVVTFGWTFWRTDRLFSKVAVLVNVPTNSKWSFQILHILANTCCCLFDYSHLSGG